MVGVRIRIRVRAEVRIKFGFGFKTYSTRDWLEWRTLPNYKYSIELTLTVDAFDNHFRFFLFHYMYCMFPGVEGKLGNPEDTHSDTQTTC